jgi:hypothetical protein
MFETPVMLAMLATVTREMFVFPGTLVTPAIPEKLATLEM